MDKTCSVEGCPSGVRARGLCVKHYNRLIRKGSTDDKRKNAGGAPCIVEGCDKPRRAFGRCDTHYRATRPKHRAPIEGRSCKFCGKPIPPEARVTRQFCDRQCKEAEVIASGRAQKATRKSYYKTLYGLTQEQMDQMLSRQGGGCAICGATTWTGKHPVPVVDHDHATGKVRGMLCSECNQGLGKFKDDIAVMEKAIEYLRAHTS